jgi:hypothetical protein
LQLVLTHIIITDKILKTSVAQADLPSWDIVGVLRFLFNDGEIVLLRFVQATEVQL